METPHIEQESIKSPESLEAINERVEDLQHIVNEFMRNVIPALDEYERVSKIVFEEERYNDTQQRMVFTRAITALSSFEGEVKKMFDVHEAGAGGSGLNDIMWSIKRVQERLIAAPDIRYNREAQIDGYKGKKNIPAGNMDAFEHTQEAIAGLRAEFMGIRSALKFMHPNKVLQHTHD